MFTSLLIGKHIISRQQYRSNTQSKLEELHIQQLEEL
tara:strand:+ start:746 stop:856 length:111 start_codon:yes stop_codon:yes gene_type:complete